MCNECRIFTDKGLYYCPESMKAFQYCPFCGELLKFPSKQETIKIETIFDYIKTLEDGSDKWRQAFIEMDKYVRDGKDPNEYLQEIMKKVERKFK